MRLVLVLLSATGLKALPLAETDAIEKPLFWSARRLLGSSMSKLWRTQRYCSERASSTTAREARGLTLIRNKSGGEVVSDAVIEAVGCRVGGETQEFATRDSSEACGAMDE